MIDLMIERVLKRRAQWDTREVNKLPDPYMINETTIIGSYSHSRLVTRKRYISRVDSVELEKGLIETPSSVARDYLLTVYKRGPIVKSTQAVALMDGMTQNPNYAAASGNFEHGFYIDIKSAYWSIMQIIGWNPDYWPGKWLSRGRAPVDFPFPDHKVSRNCLVSAGAPHGVMTTYIPKLRPGNPFKDREIGSPLTNASLIKLIQDVLNSIADDAIELGAVYVNTDGFIAPNQAIAKRIIILIEDWGLRCGIKAEGAGRVKGAGSYRVGACESVPFSMRGDVDAPMRETFAPHYRRWLQKNFSFWAREKMQTP